MKIKSFKGIHNTAPRQDIPTGACADAVNVDITGKGEPYERCAIQVRNGYSLALSAAIDSSYTTRNRISYCVSGGFLNRINSDLSFVPLATSAATEYCDSQSVLFTDDGLMVYGDVVKSLVVPQPATPPAVILTAGSREPGFYTCGYTYTNADGLESGLSPITRVELKSKGDVLVTPVDLPGYTSTIYIAPEDGSVFFDVRGTPLAPANIGTGPLPTNISSLEVMDGRLYTVEQFANYSVIRFSKPFQYHLFDYEKDWFAIADKVTYIKSTGNTLILGCSNTIFGYSQDTGPVELANYGVVPGRSMVALPDDTLLVYTVRGICSAMPFTPITEQYASLPMGTLCSTAVVNQNGVNKLIGLNDGQGAAFNAAF